MDESSDEEVQRWVAATLRSADLYRLQVLWIRRLQEPENQYPEIDELEARLYPEPVHQRELGNSITKHAIAELQALLGYVDGLEAQRASATKAFKVIYGRLTLTMRPEDRHKRPHVHVKYRNRFEASYAIDVPEILGDNGTMPARYEMWLKGWVSQHSLELQQWWRALQDGKDVRVNWIIDEEDGDQ